MRISDWSSDVCSSDLLARHRGGAGGQGDEETEATKHQAILPGRDGDFSFAPRWTRRDRCEGKAGQAANSPSGGSGSRPPRSEEHTSELQSLMRISYAVFCLKKKTHHNHIKRT